MRPRYEVSIWGRLTPTAALGSVDVTQTFTSRCKAERFARAISRHLPSSLTPEGTAQSWVLVSAYAVDERIAAAYGGKHCYMSLDSGAVVVKHHDIMSGYHGHSGRIAPRVYARAGHITE